MGAESTADASVVGLMANISSGRTWAPAALRSQRKKTCFLCLTKESAWMYLGVAKGRGLPPALANTHTTHLGFTVSTRTGQLKRQAGPGTAVSCANKAAAAAATGPWHRGRPSC